MNTKTLDFAVEVTWKTQNKDTSYESTYEAALAWAKKIFANDAVTEVNIYERLVREQLVDCFSKDEQRKA